MEGFKILFRHGHDPKMTGSSYTQHVTLRVEDMTRHGRIQNSVREQENSQNDWQLPHPA